MHAIGSYLSRFCHPRRGFAVMQSDKIFICRSLFIHGQRQDISSWKVSAQWVIKLPKEIRGIWKKQNRNYLCLNKRCDATSRTITAKQIQSTVTKPCSYVLMKVIHSTTFEITDISKVYFFGNWQIRRRGRKKRRKHQRQLNSLCPRNRQILHKSSLIHILGFRVDEGNVMNAKQNTSWTMMDTKTPLCGSHSCCCFGKSQHFNLSCSLITN